MRLSAFSLPNPLSLVRCAVALLLAMCAVAAHAQGAVASPEFHARVMQLYAFSPGKLNQQQTQQKAQEIEKFWKEVQGAAAQTLPALRAELLDASTPPYFAFDGGKLLMTLSKRPSDQAMALQAIQRVDLRDIEGTEYLLAVHWFARNGLDATQAALRVLDYPGFKAANIERGFSLEQNYSLIFMLFPMKESTFTGALAARLRSEKNPESQKSILLALWYTMSPEGRAALQGFAADRGKAREVRDYASKLLAEKVPEKLKPVDAPVEQLREERRKGMAKVNNLALHTFDTLSAKILARQ